MSRSLLRRSVIALVTLGLASMVVFVGARALPGVLLGGGADGDEFEAQLRLAM